jgi:hypothetical protein
MRLREILQESEITAGINVIRRVAPALGTAVSAMGLIAPFGRYFYQKYNVWLPEYRKTGDKKEYDKNMVREEGYLVLGIAEYYAGNLVIRSVAGLLGFFGKIFLPSAFNTLLKTVVKPAAQAALIARINSDEGRKWLAELTVFGISGKYGIELVGIIANTIYNTLEDWIREAADLPPATDQFKVSSDDFNDPDAIEKAAGQGGQTGPKPTADWDWTPSNMTRDPKGYLKLK